MAAKYTIIVPDVDGILNRGVVVTKDDNSLSFAVDLAVFDQLSIIAVLDRIRTVLVENGVEDDQP